MNAHIAPPGLIAQEQARLAQAQAQALAQQQAYDQDVARLSNLRGRDRGVDEREVAAIQARINAYAPRTAGGRTAAARELDERGARNLEAMSSGGGHATKEMM